MRTLSLIFMGGFALRPEDAFAWPSVKIAPTSDEQGAPADGNALIPSMALLCYDQRASPERLGTEDQVDARPDFMVHDRYGHLVAVIEVKAKRGTSSTWAAEFRRNLMAHESFRQAPFFLLATPDRLYLWREGTSRPEPSPRPPDLELDASLLFNRYLERAGLKLKDVGSQAFELVVMSWLGDLVLQAPDGTQQAELADSGLPQAAKDGRITFPTAA